MVDAIIKSSAIQKSFDNLTIVIIAFKNLENFYYKTTKSQYEKTQTIKIEDESSIPIITAKKEIIITQDSNKNHERLRNISDISNKSE